MIDDGEYNQRREQLLFCFEDDPYDFLGILLDSGKVTIRDLIDTIEWEDNELLAQFMGWTQDKADEES